MSKKPHLSSRSLALVSYIGIAAVLLFIYRNWLLSTALVGGDLGYLYKEQFSSYSFIPTAWETLYNLGNANTAILWAGILQHFYINTLGKILDYNTIVLIGFLVPILLIGSLSTYFLIKETATKHPFFISLGILVYMTNTYILMAAGGGQIQIALSYAFAPFVILQFMKLILYFKEEKIKLFSAKQIKLSFIAGLVVAIQMMFDPRMVYITMIAVGIFYLVQTQFKFSKKGLTAVFISLMYIFLIPLSILVLLHAIWIFPTLLFRQNPIQEMGSAFNSLGAVKFFSFAQFENSLSLLHPNWPENIFGKVGFMRAEFLAIPIFAYCGLLYIKHIKTPKIILFFALIGLLGAFLAKGANDPFGGVYLWLFDNFPGFVMFRDPSKFYLLVALSYSVLVSFSLWQLWQHVKVFKLNILLIAVFLLIWLFTLHYAVLGQLGGTFKIRNIPQGYQELVSFINSKPGFFRTLWVPALQRFGFYSNTHPAILGADFLGKYSLKDLIKELSKPQTEKVVQESGIKYVIVPFDSEGEIFIEDRKYSQKQDTYFRQEMKKISWLKFEESIGGNDIYRVNNSKDRFWQYGLTKPLSWQMIDPTHYKVNTNGLTGKRLIFSEAFNPNWQLIAGGKQLPSQRFDKRFNSFEIPEGETTVDISFKPQMWVQIGALISTITLVLVVGVLGLLRKI